MTANRSRFNASGSNRATGRLSMRPVISMSAGGDASSPADTAFLLQGVRSTDLLAHIRRVADLVRCVHLRAVCAPRPRCSASRRRSNARSSCRRLDDDPVRFARLVRDRLRPARAFFVRDVAEAEALVRQFSVRRSRRAVCGSGPPMIPWKRGTPPAQPCARRSPRCPRSTTGARAKRRWPKSPISIRSCANSAASSSACKTAGFGSCAIRGSRSKQTWAFRAKTFCRRSRPRAKPLNCVRWATRISCGASATRCGPPTWIGSSEPRWCCRCA